jgi:nucleoside 2-deoxyribosyltransferase
MIPAAVAVFDAGDIDDSCSEVHQAYGDPVRECFVIMPIGSGDAYHVYRNRYEHIIQPAVDNLRVDGQQVFRCVRADFVTKSGSITRDLLGRLYRSDAVIADVTDLNPNVFYELGVRHALRSGTILIAVKGTKPPFDVGDLRVIPYEDRVGGEKDAIPQIQQMLISFLGEERMQDSPVLHAIPELAELGATKEYEARLLALQRERDLLRAQLEVAERTGLANQASLEALRDAIEQLSRRLSEPQRQDAQAEIQSLVRSRRLAMPSVGAMTPSDVEVQRDIVFVLMPFSQELEPVYEVIEDAAREAGLRSYRADSIMAPGSIIDQIFESIAKSGLVVADLSGRNQNVMYELGLATAMGKETLLLAQDLEEVPFDLRHRRMLMYELRPVSLHRLRENLRKAFAQFRGGT